MYTHFSILKSGSHQGKTLITVPANYLLAIYRFRMCSFIDGYLMEYISKHLKSIKVRYEKESSYFVSELPKVNEKTVVVQKTKEIHEVHWPCKKYTFLNKKEANRRLKEIYAKAENSNLPIRSYECEICGYWHHTSLTKEDFKSLVPKKNKLCHN